MDLSFTRFEHDAQAAASPDLSVLLTGVAARQAASPTAMVQARIERRPIIKAIDSCGVGFAPTHGAFSSSVAGLLAGTASAAWSKP